MCRGVSLEKFFLIAFFGSAPTAITLRTLSTSPTWQAMNSSSSSIALWVDIFVRLCIDSRATYVYVVHGLLLVSCNVGGAVITSPLRMRKKIGRRWVGGAVKHGDVDMSTTSTTSFETTVQYYVSYLQYSNQYCGTIARNPCLSLQ